MSAHVPVLMDEVLHWLEPREGGLYVDGTFGAGGYTRGILGVDGTRVLGIDRDPSVKPQADLLKDAYPKRFAFGAGPFSMMEEIMERADSSGPDGIVLDLGVSSMQIDEAVRGFSFQKDGPLDMRMARHGPSAADAVQHLSEADLTAIFRVYGEEKRARRAAQFIGRARADEPITTTLQLADIISRAVGGKPGRTHPATRVFQALRIFINDELGELIRGLLAAERILKPAGRLVIVTFHSLEDRIVKLFFRERAGLNAGGSRHAPEVEKGPEPSFALLTRKAIDPGETEIVTNPRARSSRLRAAARTAAPAWTSSPAMPGGVPSLDKLMEFAS